MKHLCITTIFAVNTVDEVHDGSEKRRGNYVARAINWCLINEHTTCGQVVGHSIFVACLRAVYHTYTGTAMQVISVNLKPPGVWFLLCPIHWSSSSIPASWKVVMCKFTVHKHSVQNMMVVQSHFVWMICQNWYMYMPVKVMVDSHFRICHGLTVLMLWIGSQEHLVESWCCWQGRVLLELVKMQRSSRKFRMNRQ